MIVKKTTMNDEKYKKKYYHQKEKTKELKIFYDNKISELEKENKTLKLKILNSQIAKNGYKEEELVANNLNDIEKLYELFMEFTEIKQIDIFKKVVGNGKTDISDFRKINIQVKKYKKKQFGQVDRHWVDDLVNNIPKLNTIVNILKGLCEIPLKECGNLVNAEIGRKKLDNDNYTKNELTGLLDILNNNKLEIFNYIFLGKNEEFKPNYLCGVEYEKNIRKKIVMYKMVDVIKYLEKFNFIIKKSKTVIEIGNCISIQRKGGDGGKKTSNQIQFKLIFSSLNILNKLEYFF
jgi:hypothetical protein